MTEQAGGTTYQGPTTNQTIPTEECDKITTLKAEIHELAKNLRIKELELEIEYLRDGRELECECGCCSDCD